MDFSWVPHYWPLLINGLSLTIQLLVISCVFGFILAVPIGLVQVTGPWPFAWAARGFCTTIRGTPLLIQLWLLYYGLGSLFPQIPWIRESIFWPILREGYFYALVAFILSFAGYEGEVMRGAFLGVPKGELEAGRAFGMSRWGLLRRIWLPRAIRLVLPTLAGEVVLQLKSTPIAFTVTVMDLYGAAYKVRQDTYLVYPPLIVVTVAYVALTVLIVLAFQFIERQVPVKR